MVDYKEKAIGEVKDLGEVYQVADSLDKQIEAFIKVGIEAPYLVSPEETCMIRIAELSNDWTRTSMMPVGVEGENQILYRLSLLMNPVMAKVAVNAHANGKCLSFDRKLYEAVKEIAEQELSLEPEDRTAFILSNREDYELTPEMDDTRFIFREPTQEYFNKFEHKRIKLLNLPTHNLPKNECIMNYLWFGGPGDGSVLGCWSGGLYGELMAFGVLRKTGEASSQNFALTSIKNAITTATPKTLESLGLPRITDIVLNPLEKSILETLRNQ